MINKFEIFRKISVLIICFFTLAFVVLSVFRNMNRNIQQFNEDTVEKMGFTYLSGLTTETVNHSKTYFGSRFETLDRTLSTSIDIGGTPDEIKDYIKNEITSGVPYIALLKDDGKREILKGDENLRPLDLQTFETILKEKKNKVILTTDGSNKRMVEMVMFKNFSIGENNYCALLCGIEPDTLNTVLNLFYGEEMVYSFVVRKKDSDFVVRNEDAQGTTYFDRINKKYENYNGMKPEDYIQEIKTAMADNREYKSVFKINGERRIMYARPFSYSDWYLITFMHYNEMEEILEENNEKRSDVFNKSLEILCIVFFVAFICYVIASYLQMKKHEELKEKAILANKAKSEFLSNMSHDIRTPMNAVLGMTAIAQNNIDDKIQVENCLRKIAISGKHLLGLINDILDMSKIESGKMTLNMDIVSLNEEIDSIVSIIRLQAKEKHQKFDVYLENFKTEKIICDGVRLNQVIINFLSNAVKFTPIGGRIIFSVSEEKSLKGDNFCRMKMRVKDNGIGMSEDFQKIVFESFAREDSKRVHKTEGSGLGMAISKYIVDTMGGTIEVKSQLNKGTEFTITLDFEKAKINEEKTDFPNWNVLVVDDDEMICKSTVDILNSLGINADSMPDGKSTLKIIEENPDFYNVIIIDWQLPDIDGIETVKCIRKKLTKKIPVLLISAYDWGDIEENAKEAGIDNFISKPLFRSTLIRAFNQFVNQNPETEKIHNETKPITEGLKVLVAEDNDLNWEIAEALLSEKKISCKRAENGKICLDMLAKENDFDAVLMDIRMPIMNGFEATQEIRKIDGKTGSIPIIAMTADAFSEDMKKCLECGMNAHIAKPIDIDEVERILEKYVVCQNKDKNIN